MAQVTIYLPDEVARAIRREARRAQKSVSAYMVDLATRKGKTKKWPKDYFKVFGTWEGDFPEPEDPPPEEVQAV